MRDCKHGRLICESCRAETDQLRSELERVKNLAAGMFWAGGNFDDKTAAEIVAIGASVRSDLKGRHGHDCPKVAHIGDGYLHSHDDDGEYEVDGIWYCGRCHAWMGVDVPAKAVRK